MFENKLANALQPGQPTVPPGSIDTFAVIYSRLSLGIPAGQAAFLPREIFSQPIRPYCSFPQHALSFHPQWQIAPYLSLRTPVFFLPRWTHGRQSTAKTKYGFVLMGQYFQVVL